MSGKHASRIGNKVSGGVIVQGSRTVLIGSQNGVACSVCPGGVDPIGNPVNPMLGAKILSGETDLMLPGPLPFVISRNYSSYQTDTPGPVGLFGPGWQLPAGISLNFSQEALTLNDSGGRSIRFDPLSPGEIAYSRSERLWLVRGGQEMLSGPQAETLAIAWQGLPAALRRQFGYIFATAAPLGPWWCFGTLPAALPPPGQRLMLQGFVDRFGRRQLYLRAEDGPFEGQIVEVIDGSGRRYALDLIRLPDIVSAPGWGMDDGIRLAAVRLLSEDSDSEPPDTPLATYQYTTRGELAAVYGRDGKLRRRFEYHSTLVGRMTAHSYAGRPTSRYEYDAEGRVVEQINPQGLNYRFEYRSDRTVVGDHLGRKRTYHFEGKGGLRRVVKLERADGSCTQSRFDGSGRRVASIDPLGRETIYELDTANGNLLGVTLPDGKRQRFAYDVHHSLTRIIFPNGSEARAAYDILGRLIKETNPLGHSTRYRYADNNSGQPFQIEDAKGGIKHLDWNAQGQLQCHTDCSGSSTRYHYDRWGRLTRIEGEEGWHLRHEYDKRGRHIASIDALGQKTAYAYDDAGDLVRIVYPDDSEASLDRDVWGDLCGYAYGGQIQRYRHDTGGRLTEITDENGARAVFHYDKMDRLIEEIGFDGHTRHYRYNLAGELVQSESAGKITEYRYDDGGRLLEKMQPGIGGQPISTNFSYDDNGALSEARHVTDPAGVMIGVFFERNELGQLIAETQEARNATGETVWSHRVEHRYDALGTECQTILKDLPVLTWQAYGSGHPHGLLLDQTPLLDFERDKLHRETERRFGPVIARRHYDPLSRLAEHSVRSPAIGEMLDRRHHYDRLGQLVQVDIAGGAQQYRYDPAGRLVEASRSGHEESYRFDAAGNRLFPLPDVPELPALPDMPLSACPGNRIDHDSEYRYRYDDHGSLLLKYRAGDTHFYGYDGAQRLIRYARETPERVVASSYLYDPFGRRVAKQTIETDGEGRTTGEVKTTWYGWDGDRLILTEEDGRRIHTVYHPRSFVPLVRIEGEAKTQPLGLAQNLQKLGAPLEAGHIAMLGRIEEESRQDALSTPSRHWLGEAKLTAEQLEPLIAETEEAPPPHIHLYHCDHLGTPIALIDRNGSVDWSIELDAWGNVRNEHNPKNLYQPIRFQGQHADPENGLYYNRHRYYDPKTGRYISQDPSGFFGGTNFYDYPPNPMEWTDPLGLQQQTNPTTPVSATGAARGSGVVVTNSDNSVETRTGGTRAWRNNNPGNIRGGTYANNHGAIGSAGGFAVFPDEATGATALRELLCTERYQNMTISEAINTYAPPSENDTAGYQAAIERGTGLPGTTPMNGLTTDQLNSVIGVIRQQEGWGVGTVTTTPAPAAPATPAPAANGQ